LIIQRKEKHHVLGDNKISKHHVLGDNKISKHHVLVIIKYQKTINLSIKQSTKAQ